MASSRASSNVIDPYHFVLFQHGVLGYAGDFDNIIECVLIDHHLALEESGRYSSEQGGMRHTVSKSYHDIQALRAASCQCVPDEERRDPPAVPITTNATTVSRPTPHAQQSSQGPALSLATRAERRQAARDQYKLSPEFRGSSRVYEAGHLTLYVPGVNNFFRTNAGIHVCTARLMTDFIPIFREWLATVDSAEAERARQHARARKMDTAALSALKPSRGATSQDNGLCENDVNRMRNAGAATSLAPASIGESWSGFSQPSTTPPTSGAALAELYTPTPVCFSCVGHSFGGIILREFLFLLLTNEAQGDLDRGLFQDILSLRRHMQRLNMTFENYTTLATPHCGVSECLWWPLKIGAYCLDKMRIFPTYGELLTTDTQQQLRSRLIDRRHLLALRVFRRRTLFANTQRDLLVGFGAASLIFEDVEDDHTKARGFQHPRQAFCASAFETDACEVSAPIYLPRYCAGHFNLTDTESIPDEDAEESEERDGSSIPHSLNQSRGSRATPSAHTTPRLSRFSVSSVDKDMERTASVARMAERDAAADRMENLTYPPQYPAPLNVAPLMPHHTYEDLADALTRPSTPANGNAALSTTSLPRTATRLPRADNADRPGASTQPDRTSRPPSPIASAPSSTLSETACDAQRGAELSPVFKFYRPPEVPAPDGFIIRAVVQEHRQWKADEAARARQQTRTTNRGLFWCWGNAHTNGESDGTSDDGGLRDTVTEAMNDLDAYARVKESERARQQPWFRRRRSRGERSLNDPLREHTIPSLGELALLTSAGPRPLVARVTGWLLDVPMSIFGGLWRRFRSTTVPMGPSATVTTRRAESTELSERTHGTGADDDVVEGAGEKSQSRPARLNQMRRRSSSSRHHRRRGPSSFIHRTDTSIVFEEQAKQLPTFVEMPRSIAYRLRKHLDWRVRAIRYKHRIPTAHVACLGNWAWAGQSPDIVQSIAEEVLRIL